MQRCVVRVADMSFEYDVWITSESTKTFICHLCDRCGLIFSTSMVVMLSNTIFSVHHLLRQRSCIGALEKLTLNHRFLEQHGAILQNIPARDPQISLIHGRTS